MAIERGGVIDFEDDDWEDTGSKEYAGSDETDNDKVSKEVKLSKEDIMKKEENKGAKDDVNINNKGSKTGKSIKKRSKKRVLSKESQKEDITKEKLSDVEKSKTLGQNTDKDNTKKNTLKKSTKRVTDKKVSKDKASSKLAEGPSDEERSDKGIATNKKEKEKKQSGGGLDSPATDDTKEVKESEEEYLTLPKINSTKIWGFIALTLFIILIISIFASGFNKGDRLSKEAVSDKILSFVKSNSGISNVDVVNISEESDLYKIVLSVQGRNIDTYMTLDGKILFPSAIDMSESKDINIIGSRDNKNPSDNLDKNVSDKNTSENTSDISSDSTPDDVSVSPKTEQATEQAANIGGDVVAADNSSGSIDSGRTDKNDNPVSTETFLELTARKYRFIPYEIKVSKGSDVLLNVKSEDIEHTFTLDEFGIDEIIPAGGSIDIRFTPDKSGEYQFRSKSNPAMSGTLIVT